MKPDWSIDIMFFITVSNQVARNLVDMFVSPFQSDIGLLELEIYLSVIDKSLIVASVTLFGKAIGNL